MKLVKIHWNDIVGGKDWMSLKEAKVWGDKKFGTIYYTVGYVIFKNKDYLLVASTWTLEDDGELAYNDISMIPLSVITKIEDL